VPVLGPSVNSAAVHFGRKWPTTSLGVTQQTVAIGCRADVPGASMLSVFLLLAKRDGNASPMAVAAGNNFQVAANLLYESKDEFHPEAFALGNLKSSGQSWPVVQH